MTAGGGVARRAGMDLRRHRWLALVALGLCACHDRPAAPPSSARPPATLDGAPTTGASRAGELPAPAPFDWSGYRGRCVVLQGYAGGGGKTDASLRGGAWSIALTFADSAGADAWWALPPGARVQVQGVVAERHDPRVFVQQPGAPIEQGIPVPPGTDLEQASRRDVVEQATARLLRPLAEVEAELTAEIGKDVALNGLVWSVNGHWWFQHDGVDMHLDGLEAVPGWQALHGRAVTLEGRLERRALPRLDQILLKPKPDLADAFVVRVRALSAHPAWPVGDCAPTH